MSVGLEDLGPHFVKQLHEGVVDHEGNCNIQHDSAHSGNCALVKCFWSLIFHDAPKIDHVNSCLSELERCWRRVGWGVVGDDARFLFGYKHRQQLVM